MICVFLKKYQYAFIFMYNLPSQIILTIIAIVINCFILLCLKDFLQIEF